MGLHCELEPLACGVTTLTTTTSQGVELMQYARKQKPPAVAAVSAPLHLCAMHLVCFQRLCGRASVMQSELGIALAVAIPLFSMAVCALMP